MAIFFLSKMAAGRHLGFCYWPKVTSRQVADCPCLPPCQIWWQYLKWRPSYCDFTYFKMAAGRHLGFGPTDLYHHPRRQLRGLKCPVKFRIYPTYCFEDIKNSIFLTFGLKLPNHAHFLGVLWGFDTLNIFFSHQTLKKHILGWSRVVWGIDRENPSTRFCCRRRQEKKGRKGKVSHNLVLYFSYYW